MNRIMRIHGKDQYVSDGELEVFILREGERLDAAKLAMDKTAIDYHTEQLAWLISLRAENLYEAAA